LSSKLGSPLTLSIVIPTYNEAENILNLIYEITQTFPRTFAGEIIIVDDDSPDDTGEIVEKYITSNRLSNKAFETSPRDNVSVKVIHQENKKGLIAAILRGVESSVGDMILVMDGDFSHPPEAIPRIIDELTEEPNCIVVASRYVDGGSILGWPYKRRIISNAATQIARYGLNVRNVKDPLSGYFAFPKHIVKDIRFDTKGYKILLELLVKLSETVRIKEIPYTFSERKVGESKLDHNVIIDYVKAVWHLYRYGIKTKSTMQTRERRESVLFLSKAARFFTVGASGLVINYLVSFLLSNGLLSNLWYFNASMIGIIVSITSNFLLDKAWTFGDRDFSPRHTLTQYGMFLGSSSIAAATQLMLVYLLVESDHMQFGLSLLIAVGIGSIGNFMLNKKWTFREKIWG
jgi:dolichol-phosphate mannosyltransferase